MVEEVEIDDVVKRAQLCLEKDQKNWGEIYEKAREDLFFLSDDKYAQWEAKEYNDRAKAGRPALTIDQLGQFIHQVENDIRMNTPTINVIPDGSGSDVETAEIFKGLIKDIEYKSNADAAYDTGASFAVRSSLGFIRVDHDYSYDEGFEQELRIKRVTNPAAVYIDSNTNEPDGSDAKHGIILDTLTVRDFKKNHPGKNPVSFTKNPKQQLGDDDEIVIAEFFEITEEKKTIGQTDAGEVEPLSEGKDYKSKREVGKKIVKRYLLSGEEVLSETTFPGRYIPIVPVYGEEAWVEGKRNLLSLIRKSKDAQRMYNYWKSLETELLMKQQQAPILAAEGTTEAFAADYINPAKTMVLRYSQLDSKGQPAPKPERLQPPTIPTGIVNASRETVDDIKATMGMYNASLGQRSNEASGKAINARKAEGDVATYHFGDNLVRSITQVGRILVCAIPEIYDSARIIKIIGDEDEPKTVGINGEMVEGQEQHFDLTKGKYDVKVVTGAPFTTQRQEAAEFFTNLLTAMPELMPVIGDLAFKFQDFRGAQAVSARMKKFVDPKFLDEKEKEENAPDPEKAQMMAVIQELQKQLQIAQQDQQIKVGELAIKQEEVNIKKEDLKLKQLTTLGQMNQPKEQAAPSASAAPQAPIASPDDSIEVLQARIAQKITEQQQAEQEAIQQQQLLAMAQAEEAESEQQEMQLKMADMQAREQQANALILTLQGIQTQLAQLTQNASAPINIIRDENGNIQGVS